MLMARIEKGKFGIKLYSDIFFHLYNSLIWAIKKSPLRQKWPSWAHTVFSTDKATLCKPDQVLDTAAIVI